MGAEQWDRSRCSVAGTLAVVGEKWSLLVLREAFLGVRRFADFHRILGAPKAVLTDRLTTLVEQEILDRVRYEAEGERQRHEYRLTAKGRHLYPTLVALMAWGDRYLCDAGITPRELRHRDWGAPGHLELVSEADHREPGPRDVQPEPAAGCPARATCSRCGTAPCPEGSEVQRLEEGPLPAVQHRDRRPQREAGEVLRLGVRPVGALVVVDLEEVEDPGLRAVGVGHVELVAGLRAGRRGQLGEGRADDVLGALPCGPGGADDVGHAPTLGCRSCRCSGSRGDGPRCTRRRGSPRPRRWSATSSSRRVPRSGTASCCAPTSAGSSSAPVPTCRTTRSCTVVPIPRPRSAPARRSGTSASSTGR